MTTWNPSDKSATVTLSNGNLTAKATTAADCAVRSDTSKSSGKIYFEVVWVGSIGGDTASGIATSSAALGTVGAAPTGAALVYTSGTIWINNVNTGIAIGSVASNTVCFAIDLVNSRFWARLNGGSWNNDPSFNPARNIGGLDISALFPANPAFAIASFASATPTATLYFGTSFPVPAGFSLWDGSTPTNVLSASRAGVGSVVSVRTVSITTHIAGVGTVSTIPEATPVTTAQIAGLAREALVAATGTLNVAGIAREVLGDFPVQATVQGVVREVVGASPGEVQVRGLVRELVVVPGGTTAVVQGLVRELVGATPYPVAVKKWKQYAVTVNV